MKSKQIIKDIIVTVLTVLWIYTALSKFLDFQGFTYDMNNQPFPNELTPVLVWIIPLSEFATAVALIVGPTRSLGLTSSSIMMGLFTVYTALVLMKVFAYVPCSCGGVIEFLTWPQHLVFNLFFVVLSVAGLWLERQTKNTERNESVTI